MSRAERLEALRLELRHRSRATVIDELAAATLRMADLERGAKRCRDGWRAAITVANLAHAIAVEAGELLAAAGHELGLVRAELQRTAELLAEARAAAVPRVPPPEPVDAAKWRARYEQAKSELRRLRAATGAE